MSILRLRRIQTGIFIVLLMSPIGCTESDREVSVESVLEADGPDQETWEPQLFIDEKGKPLIHLRADYMARYEALDSTWMVLSALETDSSRVRVDLFDENGDSSAVVWADQIIYIETSRRFTARGNVLVESQLNRTLTSEHLVWDEATRRVSTPGFATLMSPGRLMNGYRFSANEDLTEFGMVDTSGLIDPDEE